MRYEPDYVKDRRGKKAMVVTTAFHMYWYGDYLTHIGRYSLKPGGCYEN